jgi:Ankyrin repeats (3 copies)
MTSDELLAALNTNLAEFEEPTFCEENVVQLKNVDELLHLCSNNLRLSGNGQIDFNEIQILKFVRSATAVNVGFYGEFETHERLAVACLKHMRCLNKSTILGLSLPGANTLQESPCSLEKYITSSWPEHCRLVERSSRVVSAIVHRTLLSAIESSGLALRWSTREKNNFMLQLCSRQNFGRLGGTLLQMGADPNARCSFHDRTPLLNAVAHADSDLVEGLLARGGDPNSQDSNGLTAVDLACKYGRLENLILLVNHGGLLDKHTAQGEGSENPTCSPALHLASQHGHVIVEYLLAHCSRGYPTQVLRLPKCSHDQCQRQSPASHGERSTVCLNMSKSDFDPGCRNLTDKTIAQLQELSLQTPAASDELALVSSASSGMDFQCESEPPNGPDLGQNSSPIDHGDWIIISGRRETIE